MIDRCAWCSHPRSAHGMVVVRHDGQKQYVAPERLETGWAVPNPLRVICPEFQPTYQVEGVL